MDISPVEVGGHSLVLLISGLTGLQPVQKMSAVSAVPHVTSQRRVQSTVLHRPLPTAAVPD